MRKRVSPVQLSITHSLLPGNRGVIRFELYHSAAHAIQSEVSANIPPRVTCMRPREGHLQFERPYTGQGNGVYYAAMRDIAAAAGTVHASLRSRRLPVSSLGGHEDQRAQLLRRLPVMRAEILGPRAAPKRPTARKRIPGKAPAVSSAPGAGTKRASGKVRAQPVQSERGLGRMVRAVFRFFSRD